MIDGRLPVLAQLGHGLGSLNMAGFYGKVDISTMPELPEVETVMRGMVPAMQNEVISAVQVNRPDLRWPLPERMKERLEGQRVVALRRRAKYILCDLDGGESLLIHLGMSGRVLISGDPLGQFVHEHPAAEKHDHVVIDMKNGARITYNDPRRFGAMDLIAREAQTEHPLLSKLGPEPLSNGFDASYLRDQLRGRVIPIKSALLDQKVIAGLGNIYVCEALFRAGINPVRKARDVSTERLDQLTIHIRDVLQDAIDAGGSSLRDFRQVNGKLGYFQHNFDVYDRENAACRNTDCTARIARMTQAGRSTFHCPNCQR